MLRPRCVIFIGVEVPMTYVFGSSAAAVRAALLLIDLETEEGINDIFSLLHQLMAAQIRVHGLDLPELEIATQG